MTRRLRPLALAALSLAGAVAVGLGPAGCTAADPLGTPISHAAPYEQDVRWAIVPLLNESATSVADPLRVADAIQAEIQAIEGVDAIPVNRTIAAMREENILRVTTPHEAQVLMRALGVDGLIVGTITAWDPYPPMNLGLALELHVRNDRGGGQFDPYAVLVRPSAGQASLGTISPDGPVAVVADVFDSADHQVLKWVRDYAEARHVPDQAFGDRIYLVSMDRYARFAAYRLLGSIIGRERLRLAGV